MHVRGGRSEERVEGVQGSGEGARARSLVGPWDLLLEVALEQLKDMITRIPPLQHQTVTAHQLL